MSYSENNILVIRHGALGDVVLSTGPFAAIRAHHPGARIVLLTTPPYAKLLRDCPWFDEMVVDPKPKWWQWKKLRWLSRFLNGRRWERVYDLQTSGRSTLYYALFRHKPAFSGIAPGSPLAHTGPERVTLHTLDRQKAQLAIAGITEVPLPDLSWLNGDLSAFDVPERFALIVPGGSAHRPEKRWPAERYMELCRMLLAEGVVPVLIGTSAEADVLDAIVAAEPCAVSLGGKTDFGQIVALAKRAAFAVGNDTGPMHLIAASGCRSAVLFSHASNPALCAPRGGHVSVLRRERLAELSVDEVVATLSLA